MRILVFIANTIREIASTTYKKQAKKCYLATREVKDILGMEDKKLIEKPDKSVTCMFVTRFC